MATDLSQAAVINETAAEMFGWNDPIGKQFRFSFDRQLFTVIGVVSDFHFRSLQNKIEPLIFIQCWGMSNYVTARIRSDDIQSSVAYLRQEWNKIMPSFPFIYHFVKDMYSESYKEEEKLLNLISVFAVLAIVLASLGLLGLTAIITVSRTKEIGIRKTLGASVSGIVFLISKELLLWVILANTIALPAAVYFIRGWLRDYPYRINLSWWLFFMSGGLAFFIAVFMMAFQTIKVAIANPVEALRYE
jgi:putative ABC transport system permease protein